MWAQLLRIAHTDLRIEARAAEVLLVVVPAGAVPLVLLPLAIGTDLPLLRRIGPGFYWIVVLLFGLLVTQRSSVRHSPAQRALLLLCGVEPAVRALAHTLANALLLLGLEVVLLPAMVALYDPEPATWPWLAAAMPVIALGLAGLGTFASALSEGLSGQAALAPLLVLPLSVPLLLGATQVLEAVRYDRPPWPWLLLAATMDVVVLLAAVFSAGTLEDSG